MARNKGLASFSANFEAQIAAPIDARMTVATKNELYQASTWQANDGLIYTYKGMVVSVNNDTINNGVYILIADDYTSSANWITGTSGYSGIGISGYSGTSGYSGYSGTSGYSGVGTSGYSGVGTSGYSGSTGDQGYSGYSGESISGFTGTITFVE
jgi:hypothetical protein